ncbi:unnamed protein product [Polarella glacialis]|uniref:Uncharacterized protein n=1 Tax=Polarella glacialis TaxID=89957 RepID=A0A813HWH1_POLGL|nr:unnamed protein product [Polarella glacialis]
MTTQISFLLDFNLDYDVYSNPKSYKVPRITYKLFVLHETSIQMAMRLALHTSPPVTCMFAGLGSSFASSAMSLVCEVEGDPFFWLPHFPQGHIARNLALPKSVPNCIYPGHCR